MTIPILPGSQVDVACTPITETLIPTAAPVQHTGWNITEATAWESVDAIGDDTEAVFLDTAGFTAICPSTEGDDFEVRIGDPAGTPGAGACQGMEVEWRADDDTDDGEFLGCCDYIVRLKQGTTTIASQAYSDLGGPPTTRTFSLSIAEVDSISDHDDLRILIDARAGFEDAMAKQVPVPVVTYVGVNYFAR